MMMGNQEITTERNKGLAALVGTRLSSVQFVMDYLILGFEGKAALTALVWPELSSGPDQLTIGMADYRNELCSLIEKVVTTAIMDEDEVIRIAFNDGVEMLIPLRMCADGGERAIFTDPDRYLLVF